MLAAAAGLPVGSSSSCLQRNQRSFNPIVASSSSQAFNCGHGSATPPQQRVTACAWSGLQRTRHPVAAATTAAAASAPSIASAAAQDQQQAKSDWDAAGGSSSSRAGGRRGPRSGVATQRRRRRQQHEQQQQQQPIPDRPWAVGLQQAQQKQEQEQQQEPPRAGDATVPSETQQILQALLLQEDDRGSTNASSSSSNGKVPHSSSPAASGQAAWDADFVQGVLAAVGAAHGGQQRATGGVPGTPQLPAAAGERPWAPQQQQQQHEQQQQQQHGTEAEGPPVQPPRFPYADNLAADVRVRSLLALLQAGDEQGASSSSSSGRQRYGSSAASSHDGGGWWYSDSASLHPCLQRAQWLVEDMHRLQQLAWQQQQQQPLQDQDHHQQQQQQQPFADAQLDLRAELHALLLQHLTREASHWQSVAAVVQDFQAFLTPRLVAAALLALQQQHGSGRRVPAAQRPDVRRLVWHCLELMWRWQAQLGAQECTAVVWVLVRLQHLRFMKLQDSSQMRDALAQQYTRVLAAHQKREQLARRQRRKAAAAPTEAAPAAAARGQQQQEEQHEPLLPLFGHAALLLGLARLGLPAATRLPQGTCDLISRVAYCELQRERQALRSAPTCPRQRARAMEAASHAALLLYALSELHLTPSSALLTLTASFSRRFLHSLPARDVCMLATSFGRFGFIPGASWRRQLLSATGAAAAVTLADAGAAGSSSSSGGSVTIAAGAEQQPSQTWYEAAQSGSTSSSDTACAAAALNPADVTSLLSAAHSINLSPPPAWTQLLVECALAQLPHYSLRQCILLLAGLHRLQVPARANWLLSLTRHVVVLTGGSAVLAPAPPEATPDSSTSSADEQQQQQQQWQQQAHPAAGPLLTAQHPSQEGQQPQPQPQQQPWTGGSSLLERPRRVQQQQQPELQAGDTTPQLEQQQQQPTAAPRGQRVRFVDYPAKHRLCRYLWTLSTLVEDLPPEQREAVLVQLQPWVAAAAQQAAADMGRLRPLDLLLLLRGLAGLRCRPGPGFLAAFAGRVEAQQEWFTAQLYLQLRRAYAALGLTPPRSLLALMLATINTPPGGGSSGWPPGEEAAEAEGI